MTQTSKVTSLKMENCSPRAAPRAVSSRGPAGNSDSTFPSSPAPAVARGDTEVGGEHQLGAGQGPPGWSSPGRGDALPCPVTPPGHRHASPEAGSVPGRFRESESGGGSWGAKGRGGGSERSRSQRGGEASLRAKMATLGCRRGLCHAARVNPPKRHAGKGEGKTAPGELVRWGRAAAGSGGQRSPGWPRCWGRAARESRKCPLCEAGQRDFRRGELGLVPPSPPPRH